MRACDFEARYSRRYNRGARSTGASCPDLRTRSYMKMTADSLVSFSMARFVESP